MAEPVSMAESLLLARDQAAQPWHQVGVLIVEGAAPSPATLARLVAQRIGYAPRFRRKLAGTGLQSWIDDRGFKVAGHVRAAGRGAGTGISDWLDAQLNTALDRLHPLWDAQLLPNLPQDRWALVVRAHPALVDGDDNVHLLHELLDEHPAPIGGDVPRWDPAVEQATGFGGLFKNLTDPVQALRDAAAGLGGMAESGVRQATVTPVERHQSAVECSLADLKRVATGAGCTVHDVIVALATAGVRGWQVANAGTLTDPVALVPLGVNDAGASAIGCAVAPQYIQLPVTAASAAERLTAIATLTQSRIDSDALVSASELVDQAGFTPATTHAVAARTVAGGRPHQVFIANVPGPATPRWLGEQRVRALHAFASTVDEQVISVGVTSLDGRISFAASAQGSLHSFARDVSDELGVLLRVMA